MFVVFSPRVICSQIIVAVVLKCFEEQTSAAKLGNILRSNNLVRSVEWISSCWVFCTGGLQTTVNAHDIYCRLRLVLSHVATELYYNSYLSFRQGNLLAGL